MSGKGMSCESEGKEHTHLTGNRADEKRKQRGVRKRLMPTDQCGPIQTDAGRTLFFILYQNSVPGPGLQEP